MNGKITTGVVDGLLGAIASSYILKGVNVFGYNPMLYGLAIIGGAGLILTMISDKLREKLPDVAYNTFKYVIEPAVLGIIVVALVTIISKLGGVSLPKMSTLVILFAAGYVTHLIGSYISNYLSSMMNK